MLKVGDELFNAKLSSDGSELVFNIPSSGLYVDKRWNRFKSKILS